VRIAKDSKDNKERWIWRGHSTDTLVETVSVVCVDGSNSCTSLLSVFLLSGKSIHRQNEKLSRKDRDFRFFGKVSFTKSITKIVYLLFKKIR